VRRYDQPPATPVSSAPRGSVATTCTTLRAGDFSDPDGDLHGMAHWQVSTTCDSFDAPVFDSYRAFENQYEGVDLAAGDDLRDEPAVGLSPETYYCWRVRYRDRALAWSAWSTPVAFQLDADGASSCDDPTVLTPPEPRVDAGPDAGVEAPSSGCGCRAGRGGDGLAGLGALLALLIAGRARAGSSLRRSPCCR